eukprot:403366736
MRTGNRLFSVLNEQHQVNEKPLEVIEDLDKQKVKLYNRKERRELIQKNRQIQEQFGSGPNLLKSYFKDPQFNAKKETLKEKNILDFFKQKIQIINKYLHQNNDLNDGKRMSKEEFQYFMNQIRQDRQRELEMNGISSPKFIYLTSDQYQASDPDLVNQLEELETNSKLGGQRNSTGNRSKSQNQKFKGNVTQMNNQRQHRNIEDFSQFQSTLNNLNNYTQNNTKVKGNQDMNFIDIRDEQSLQNQNVNSMGYDEQLKRTLRKRDLRTQQIEEIVNDELNAIEEYEQQKQIENIVHQNKQIKAADLKGLRQQVFVNPRQAKLRKNVENLMDELKKIKAIDPNLEIFNQIYRKKQANYEHMGMRKASQNEEVHPFNEIDILMEILSAAENQEVINEDNEEKLEDYQVQTQIDRLQSHQQSLRQALPLVQNFDSKRQFTAQPQFKQQQAPSQNQNTFNNDVPTLKRAAYSQPSLLGFGKNKLKQETLNEIKQNYQANNSPLKDQRISKLEKVLKKTNSSQAQINGQHGVSLLGAKDYQGRIRNIFIEKRRKLETQVHEVDNQLLQQGTSNIKNGKALNFEFYTIKDIMSDQWVKQLTNKKFKNSDSPEKGFDLLKKLDTFGQQNGQTQSYQTLNNPLKNLKCKSERNDKNKLIDKHQLTQQPNPQKSKDFSKMYLQTIQDGLNIYKSQVKPVKPLNLETVKKEVNSFSKEIQSFNRTILRSQNSNHLNHIHQTQTASQSQQNNQFGANSNSNANQNFMATFDSHNMQFNTQYSTMKVQLNSQIISPQQEAQEKRDQNLKPLQKIRKVIQHTTKGIEL